MKKTIVGKDFQLGAVIRVHAGLNYGGADITFTRVLEDGDTWNFGYGDFDGLQISCQWDMSDSEYRKRGEPYAFHVEYRTNTTLENFTTRAALLTKVKNGLERAYKKDGECETFGEYVNRVFKTLGVEVLLEGIAGVSLRRTSDGMVWQPSEVKTVFNRLLAKTLEVK